MFHTRNLTIFLMLAGLLTTACQAQATPQIGFDPADLKFSGGRAFEIETEFVTRFPDRHSGQENNRLAAEWLLDRFTDSGWACSLDEWEIVNYSRLTPLTNVVCRLSGESGREILIVAHRDQFPLTIQGADDDASGTSILVHLAEIFGAEDDRPYTLVIVSTDAEEYGMIGSKRYMDAHPNTENIIAGISLDSVGMEFFDGLDMELVGQYRNYTPIWLALTARESAKAAGVGWDIYLRAPFDQITDQAAPVSFMDQGPIVAAGVPAIGFIGHEPVEYADLYYHLWHDPDDTLEYQSAETLGKSGLTAEALIRQLMSMESFPQESGEYIYFDGSGRTVRGAPLWIVFIGFVSLFFFGSLRAGKPDGWRNAAPHFLGLWLPLLASILLLYGFVEVGLMHKYHAYPATTKDPDLLNPRWLTIILFLVGLSLFLYLGRRFVRQYAGAGIQPTHADIKSLALFIIALGGVYVIAINPFSLLFFLPLLFWFLINGRQGSARGLDILFFALGGLVVYALIYIFGFTVLRYNFAFLWYMMYMFSTRMIGFYTAIVITAIVAAGLTMIVNPPRK